MPRARVPCRYGVNCYDHDFDHRTTYSHPSEESESDDDYTTNHQETRRPCRYGSQCYNKKPSHLKEFSHPSEQSSSDDDDASTCQETQTPCRYGSQCYNKNPSHLKEFFHPPEQSNSDADNASTCQETRTPCRYGSKCYNKKRSHLEEFSHPEIPENYSETLLSNNEARPPCKYGADCVRRRPSHFREYSHPANTAHSAAERVLATEHELPVYWGKNVFTEPYREMNVHRNSNEFRIINDLLNSTIGQHGNSWGTIYKKDPVEFVVTKITKIRNRTLWDDYCYRKVSINCTVIGLEKEFYNILIFSPYSRGFMREI